MKSYLEISISSNGQHELLIPTMIELGCSGFQETDSSLLCYIDRTGWTDVQLKKLRADISHLLKTISSNADIRFREFNEENWNASWEASIGPIEVGSKFVIQPSWGTYDNIQRRIVLRIDPKMSFGTGYHETTRLMLLLMEKHVAKTHTVLDVGTGTGILAIAAIKLGAARAMGIDIDEWSIMNARENIISNNVQRKVDISDIPIQKIQSPLFDAILANLTLNTNIEFLPHFLRLLRQGGKILLSGLLQTDAERMKQELKRYDLKLADTAFENEWIAFVAAKQ